MTLPSPKELNDIFKVCRKHGIETLEIGTIKVKFGEMPQKGEEIPVELLDDGTALPPGVTKEQMMFYSSHDPLEQREQN